MPRPKTSAPSKRPAKKQASRQAQSLTKSKPKSLKVEATRTPPKKKASKAKPDPVKAAKKVAKTKYVAPVVEHIIKKAAMTDSAVHAAALAEVPIERVRAVLGDPNVQRAVALERMTLAQECGITSQRVMKHYAAIGFSDMADYIPLLSADTLVEGIDMLTPEQSAAIQELTTETYWDEVEEKTVKRVKLKLYPKEVALDKMAKHLGIKGFGGQLAKAGMTAGVGVQTITHPDGRVETKVLVQQLSDEELYRIAAGEEEAESTHSERTE